MRDVLLSRPPPHTLSGGVLGDPGGPSEDFDHRLAPPGPGRSEAVLLQESLGRRGGSTRTGWGASSLLHGAKGRRSRVSVCTPDQGGSHGFRPEGRPGGRSKTSNIEYIFDSNPVLFSAARRLRALGGRRASGWEITFQQLHSEHPAGTRATQRLQARDPLPEGRASNDSEETWVFGNWS